jgi:hypothetical protein
MRATLAASIDTPLTIGHTYRVVDLADLNASAKRSFQLNHSMKANKSRPEFIMTDAMATSAYT